MGSGQKQDTNFVKCELISSSVLCPRSSVLCGLSPGGAMPVLYLTEAEVARV